MQITNMASRSVSVGAVGCLLFAWISSGRASDLPEYVHQFRSPDAAAGDEFGRAVALDGRFGILGAPSRDELGVDSGAVYVFDVLGPSFVQKLIPDDGQEGDLFGISVSIQGNLAVVGAMHDDDRGVSSGAAYLFDVTTGQQLHKLVPNELTEGDEFGISVDLDDGVVIVGAHMDGPGSAYLFDAATGQQLAKLRAEDAGPGELFGVAVAIDDGKALVGARYDDQWAIAAGAAYLFDVDTGRQLHKLTVSDAARGDRFGMHLDLQGNRAVVGARYDDDALKSSGSAYVYDVESGAELFKLVPSDTTPNDQFGSGISISGNLAVIGALDDDHNGLYAGSAYLFDVMTGEEVYKFNAEDAARLDRLGISVAMDDGIALLGASMLNYPGAPGLPSGKAYVYLIPEPSSLLLATLGLIVLLLNRYRP